MLYLLLSHYFFRVCCQFPDQSKFSTRASASPRQDRVFHTGTRHAGATRGDLVNILGDDGL
jgi:hypothetical protein